MPHQQDLWRWSAIDLAQAIGKRSISSRDAVQASLDRIAAVNPAVNAVVQVLADEAMVAADAADAAVKSGVATGPLHGVPVTIKVNIDQKGCATTNGVVAFRDVIAEDDSPPVANLRKAGAVIVGRTNTPAFSHRWFTDNDLHGATRNPWSLRLTPGGSSGGAAAAVAAGMGAIAHGNDFGGSIRYPAYACGVAGLRPTPGRIPAFNPSATSDRPVTAQLMSVQGPLACSVADLRLGLAAMAAFDPRDALWVPAPLNGPPPATPIRVALVPDPFGDAAPEVSAAVRAAGRLLADAGYAVEEAMPPRFQEAADLWHRLVVNEERIFLQPAIRSFGDDKSKRNLDGHIAYAPMLTADEIIVSLQTRVGVMRDWQLFLDRYPVIVMPVSQQLPFRDNQDMEGQQVFSAMLDAQRSLLATPVLGFPSVAVPTGLAGGTPVGVQVVAGRFREDLCLDAAEAIERHVTMGTPIDPRR
ncbi:amidase family protein [Bradyrhizobium prioriisuperbiae]|uniref:amidase family protein n=1 Tax=Bradyrhizobium prioriisuperbiae TaxID=2854389 RepID=UPI0028EDFE5F|nr:amidase family protein [Bradyrhizobium prioritasuperba]